MKTLRHAACVLLAAASLLASPVYATSFSTDQSDLWFNINQQGEGVQLVQRGSVIFATLFVYGPGGLPTWYTATMDYTTNLTWTGTLYATTGTFFGSPWNPAAFTIMPVGTMTWQGQTVTTGVLTWDVNGVPGTLTGLIRQALVLDDYSGHYGGGIHSTITACANSGFDGTVEDIGVVNITQNGSALTMQSLPTTGGSCTYVGTLTEFGQMGEIDDGTYTCTDGVAGTFQSFEMQINKTGFTGRFAASNSNPPGCQQQGWFGGIVVTTF